MSVIFTSYPVAFWTGMGIGALVLLVVEFAILFTVAMRQSKRK